MFLTVETTKLQFCPEDVPVMEIWQLHFWPLQSVDSGNFFNKCFINTEFFSKEKPQRLHTLSLSDGVSNHTNSCDLVATIENNILEQVC